MPVPPPPNAKKIFCGEKLDFWQWDQKMFDGTTEVFECVTRPDGVAVLPFLDPQTVLLTFQEQPSKGTFIDLPGGRVDPNEDFLEAAKRELQEETGYQASQFLEWHRIENRSFVKYEERFFIAKNLQNGFPTHRDPGERIEIRPTPWSELVQLCLHRQLRQPNIMLAILAMEFDLEAKQRLYAWLDQI